MQTKHIEIERMMFGDYRVQVWDENKDSMLDREYFCRGFASAMMTAIETRTLPGFAMLDVYYRDEDSVELVNKANQSNG